jgi:hypothetical protein
MQLKLPPNFDICTFTKREENPVRVRVSDVEEHARKAIEKINAPEMLPFVHMLRETLSAMRQTLGDEPVDPDDCMTAASLDPSLKTASEKTGVSLTPDMEFETGQNVVHFVSRETARRILQDLLGEDPFERLARLEHDGDPDAAAFARTMNVLEANVRREYWYP